VARRRTATKDKKRTYLGEAGTARDPKPRPARVSTAHRGKPRPLARDAAVQPRRRPRQARARETVTAILQAAIELAAEHGYDRVTTNAIADRAGVSIGSLYQYFPNKDAILVSLFEQHRREVRDVVESAMRRLEDPAIPFQQAMRSFFRDQLAAHDANPRLNRVISENLYYPAIVAAAQSEDGDETLGRVVGLLAVRPDVKVRDLTTAGFILMQTVGALSRWLAHEAPATLDKQLFIEQAVKMLDQYVRGGNGPTRR